MGGGEAVLKLQQHVNFLGTLLFHAVEDVDTCYGAVWNLDKVLVIPKRQACRCEDHIKFAPASPAVTGWTRARMVHTAVLPPLQFKGSKACRLDGVDVLSREELTLGLHSSLQEAWSAQRTGLVRALRVLTFSLHYLLHKSGTVMYCEASVLLQPLS